MKFCIATLSHNAPSRAEYLERTIISFLQANPSFEGDWFIFLNSYNSELLQITEKLFNQYSRKKALNKNIEMFLKEEYYEK